MIKKHYDVVIVGAGPAGMAAATVLAQYELNVAVFDEQPLPGGQVYRAAESLSVAAANSLFGRSYRPSTKLIKNFRASDVEYFPKSSVWYIDGPEAIAVTIDGSAYRSSAQFLIIATGAQERPVAFEGWQLPGVFGAGAAQILLKNAALVANDRPVLYGSGPLLYLVATQIIKAGVKPKIVLDTATRIQKSKALRRMPHALLNPLYLLEGMSFLRTIKAAGVPVVEHVTGIKACGEERLEKIVYNIGENYSEVRTSHLFSHHGVIPETKLVQSLRCKCHWDDGGQCWVPTTDEWGESTRKNVFVIGDNAGITGARSAPLLGQIAALQIVCGSGAIDETQRNAQAQRLRRKLSHDKNIRPFLETYFRVSDSVMSTSEQTIVCRCESVRAGEILKAAREGCMGPNQLKAFTRCGMGACQGRMCGPIVETLISTVHGLSQAEVGRFRARAPVRPVTLEILASLSKSEPAGGSEL